MELDLMPILEQFSFSYIPWPRNQFSTINGTRFEVDPGTALFFLNSVPFARNAVG